MTYAFKGAVCTPCRWICLPPGLEECTVYHGTRACEICGEPTQNGCVLSSVPLAALVRLKLKDALEAWRSIPPHDMVLFCPACGKQHIDIGEFETRVHRKHLCENTTSGEKTGCGHVWVPFPYATRGVPALRGDAQAPPEFNERLPPEWAGKKFDEAVKRACAEPSLAAALSWIAVWENDRVVKQAMRGERDPNTHQLWDTCFYYCFKRVFEAYPPHPPLTLEEVAEPQHEDFSRHLVLAAESIGAYRKLAHDQHLARALGQMWYALKAIERMP